MQHWCRLALFLPLLLAACADTQKADGARPAMVAAPPALPAPAPAPAPGEGFAGWSAVIVSGDWRSGDGRPSQTFDNARRDLGQAFVRAGFQPRNMRQFSAAPAPVPGAGEASFANIAGALDGLLRQAGDGCLLYVTSHGSEQGVLVGRQLVPPQALAQLLRSTCAGRPTVVVVSACHSGIFIQPLAAPNRLIVAAARADRPSFGCGEDDLYPYFDACMLENWSRAPDLPALAEAARTCVARREQAEGFPASLPQISLGQNADITLRRLGLPGN